MREAFGDLMRMLLNTAPHDKAVLKNVVGATLPRGVRADRAGHDHFQFQGTQFDAAAEFLTFLWWKSGSGIRQP
jgi:hypothetical protein